MASLSNTRVTDSVGGISLAERFGIHAMEEREQAVLEQKKKARIGDEGKDSRQIQDDILAKVKGLTFQYYDRTVLRDINLELRPGDRCLLIGRNGAGKSTLLRVLAGKHLPPPGCHLSVLGTRAPQDQTGGLAYLGNNWSRTVAFAASNVAYQCDIPVREMMVGLQKEYAERRNMLVKLLGINLDWRMHQVSDGQRRRVQLFLGLIRPFRVLLMDEITVDLDIVARQDLLNFLRRESEERGAAILYATHILDGLDDWVTGCMYLQNGGRSRDGLLPMEKIPEWAAKRSAGVANPLLRVIEQWMRAEQDSEAIVEESEEVSKKVANDGMLGPQGGFGSGRLGKSRFAAYNF